MKEFGSGVVDWAKGLTGKKEAPGETEEKPKSQTDVSKPVDSDKISSEYGKRDDVDIKKVGGFHSGIDYAVPKGTSVVAFATGEVIEVVDNTYYGKSVVIKHENGMTSYSIHLDTTTVKQGDNINTGTQIGTSGNTGEFASNNLNSLPQIIPTADRGQKTRQV